MATTPTLTAATQVTGINASTEAVGCTWTAPADGLYGFLVALTALGTAALATVQLRVARCNAGGTEIGNVTTLGKTKNASGNAYLEFDVPGFLVRAGEIIKFYIQSSNAAGDTAVTMNALPFDCQWVSGISGTKATLDALHDAPPLIQRSEPPTPETIATAVGAATPDDLEAAATAIVAATAGQIEREGGALDKLLASKRDSLLIDGDGNPVDRLGTVYAFDAATGLRTITEPAP